MCANLVNSCCSCCTSYGGQVVGWIDNSSNGQVEIFSLNQTTPRIVKTVPLRDTVPLSGVCEGAMSQQSQEGGWEAWDSSKDGKHHLCWPAGRQVSYVCHQYCNIYNMLYSLTLVCPSFLETVFKKHSWYTLMITKCWNGWGKERQNYNIRQTNLQKACLKMAS